MNDFLISVVVPCFNEAENIPVLLNRMKNVLEGYCYEIILVNDGSTDPTQQVIDIASLKDSRIFYLSFSRNFGHQAALKAGIDHAKGNCIVTIDADLQKPPEVIPEMIVLWQEGNDIVTAVSRNEGQPSVVKRWTSTGFYKIFSGWQIIKLCGTEQIFD